MSSPYKFRLTTTLPASTCVERLRAVTAEGLFAGFTDGDKPVVGSVDEAGFKWRKQIRQQNSFQLHLWGKISTDPGGTQIDCRAAMHPGVKIFMAIWCGFVVVMACLVLFSDMPFYFNDVEVQNRGTSLFFFLPFLMFGIGLPWVGRFFARNEPAFMCDLLCRTLDARIDDASSHGGLASSRQAATQQATRSKTVQR